MKKTATLFLSLLLLATIGMASDSVSTSNGLTAAGGPLAIHGYDAVSYFEGNQPERGLAKYSAKHDGVVYRFASKSRLEAFETNPERYAPQFGGFCAFGVSVGKKFDGDPEVYEVVDGKLYFNLNPDIQKSWKKDIPGNISKAEGNWPKIKNKPASEL